MTHLAGTNMGDSGNLKQLAGTNLGDSGNHEAASRNIKLGREEIASNHLQPREGIINIARRTYMTNYNYYIRNKS